jgi:hypothetical protein
MRSIVPQGTGNVTDGSPSKKICQRGCEQEVVFSLPVSKRGNQPALYSFDVIHIAGFHPLR